MHLLSSSKCKKCLPFTVYKGLTTYEYIVMLREKDGYHDSDGQKQTSTSNARPSLSIKVNILFVRCVLELKQRLVQRVT